MTIWWWAVGTAGIVWDPYAAGQLGPFAASVYRRLYRASWWMAPAGVVVGGIGMAVVVPDVPIRALGIGAAALGGAAFRHYAVWLDLSRATTTKDRRRVTDLARGPRMAWTGAGFVVLTVAMVLGVAQDRATV